MTFKKGKPSANPVGRPKGSVDRRLIYRDMLASQMPALVNKAIELALKGDTAALKLCIERGMPARKVVDESVHLGKPLTGSTADQGRVVLEALGEERLTPDQASTIMTAVASQARIIEVQELDDRIAALEQRAGIKKETGR